jgi:hypothetical protein
MQEASKKETNKYRKILMQEASKKETNKYKGKRKKPDRAEGRKKEK